MKALMVEKILTRYRQITQPFSYLATNKSLSSDIALCTFDTNVYVKRD